MSTTFDDLAALFAAGNGQPVESAPYTITQTMIDDFARTTSDHYWIHVDTERARRESPSGTTIAHGFLTLSLLVPMLHSCIALPAARKLMNYGFERVRFIAPVPAGSVLVGRFALTGVTRTESGTRMVWQSEIVSSGSERPVLVATWLLMLLG